MKNILMSTLVLVSSIYASPLLLDITAEEFSKLKEYDILPSNNSDIYTPLTKRQNQCNTVPRYRLTLVGDGNPHQNFVITQKANTVVSCPGSSTFGVSTTIGWTANVNVGFSKLNPFSFGVSESKTQAASQTVKCEAGVDSACVLVYDAVTAYTVNVKSETPSCFGADPLDLGNAIIYAPNANGEGSITGRGINVQRNGVIQCVGNVDRVVTHYCGPPGRPDWWIGKSQGPWNPDYLAAREPAGCIPVIEAGRFTDP